MKGSTECPKIIEKTNWEQYLGLAPLAAAINKQCSWKVRLSGFICAVLCADWIPYLQGVMTDVVDAFKCGGKCIIALIEG